MRVESETAGFRVESLDFRVQGSGFRVQGSGFRAQGSGFRVDSGFRVQGSEFRVQGAGFGFWRPGEQRLLRSSPARTSSVGNRGSRFGVGGLGSGALG